MASDDAVAYEYDVRGTIAADDDWHTTLAHDHPDDAIADVETLEYRNVRGLTYLDDHRLAGALPEEQPAPAPWVSGGSETESPVEEEGPE